MSINFQRLNTDEDRHEGILLRHQAAPLGYTMDSVCRIRRSLATSCGEEAPGKRFDECQKVALITTAEAPKRSVVGSSLQVKDLSDDKLRKL